ncbi:MAG: ABC transporter permease [Longicatena sp.]|jgi:putative tryptophan/tyrosine transport system permease protein|uniref:ABC transporter permease n=1 Tax=Anaerorhabdus sp. TaxID=1872524 RepID=UPI002FCB4633
MSLSLIIGAIEIGIIFGICSLGLFMAFRILNLPDLTVDGSFVTGLAFSAIFAAQGQPLLGIILGVLGGVLAGIITGVLHTKFKIQEILAGILTMTALYSINLKIMNNQPSIFLYGIDTIFTPFLNKIILGGVDFGNLIVLAVIAIFLVIVYFFFFKTLTGLALRATGDNEAMVRSSSINTDTMKILGFAITNAVVALGGGLYAQYTQTAAHGAGVGTLVLCCASIIIGETVFGKKRGMLHHLISILLGAVLYRLLISYAFVLGLPASDLKLFSALIVVVAMVLPQIKFGRKKA